MRGAEAKGFRLGLPTRFHYKGAPILDSCNLSTHGDKSRPFISGNKLAELASQPTSVQSVYAWYAEHRLYVNRRYQRKLVWTLEEKQKLIESILRKYPIPAILIAEREAGGSYEIIDGLQRLHAITSFIEGQYATAEGLLFNLDYFTTAKARKDSGAFAPIEGEQFLTQRQVSTLLDYSLPISVMRGATDAEIDDVFGRINTYGHRLSDQERRQAGVQNDFSELVRELASTLRGDASPDVLTLENMPSISIDLPMTKHGYEVKAEEVFWVSEGVLRATDLRDSMDEQCIADIAACIVSGGMIERSKDALDDIYTRGSPAAEQMLNALEVYGRANLRDEVKFCVDEILKICAAGKNEKLRSIIFKNKTTNPFPAVFAVLVVSIHELIVKDELRIATYGLAKEAITNLSDRIDTSRGSTAPDERRKNVDTIKGLLSPRFVKGNLKNAIYSGHTTIDIDADIRRSELELANYELKQGMLKLDNSRTIDTDAVQKVLRTLVGMANNGKDRAGQVMLGVTDKRADADRIKELDGIEARKVGRRYVAGVSREAKVLGISTEEYLKKWRDSITQAPISEPLKSHLLANMDYNSFFGLGVIVLRVPPQKDVSYFDNRVFRRDGDQTIEVTLPQEITNIARRF